MRVLFPLLLAGCGAPAPPSFSVVSFNSGTTEGLAHDADRDDGYTSEQAAVSDQYYGDGLAWPTAIEAARSWFAAEPPDLVAFQEIFSAEDCLVVPTDQQSGWFCEGWQEGDPTVAETVLGPDYNIACHEGKPDKCIAVHSRFGEIAGCEGSLCPPIEGAEVEGCGSGARVAWADIERVGGSQLRMVHVHGSSGLSDEDQDCRIAQFEAAFEEVRLPTILLGDLNTDPGRWTELDRSAAAFNQGAEATQLHFISPVGEDVEPSYGGVVNIDHVLSDVFVGGCETPGVSEGLPSVLDTVYFDHHPVRCEVQ